jgi:hypothetical protein
MGLDDVTARKNLNTLYRRGQAGRSWLSNDEQAVLKSTLSGPRLRLVFTVKDRKGVVHGYITSNEAEILRQAGKLPEGEQGVVRGHPVWYIKPVF